MGAAGEQPLQRGAEPTATPAVNQVQRPHVGKQRVVERFGCAHNRFLHGQAVKIDAPGAAAGAGAGVFRGHECRVNGWLRAGGLATPAALGGLAADVALGDHHGAASHLYEEPSAVAAFEYDTLAERRLYLVARFESVGHRARPSSLKTRRRATAALMSLLCVLLMGVADASAQMFITTGRDALRGLPGLEVAVETLPPDLTEAGLDAARTRVLVADRLRRGGVTVYPRQQDNPSVAKPYVYILLNGLALPGGGHAIALSLQVRQSLRSPATGSTVVNAVSWETGNVFVVPAGGLPALQVELERDVDQLLRDWTSVH